MDYLIIFILLNEIMFFTMLVIQLVAHVVIHIGNKGYIHRNLK